MEQTANPLSIATTADRIQNWPDRLLLSVKFDPVRLREDLHRLAGESWTEHFVKQNYEGEWSVLPLRSTVGATHPIMRIYSDPSKTDYEDTELLAPCPAFREVMTAFACPLLAVRLMRLAPGSCIKEHRDHDLDGEAETVRIHIPVTTNPDVVFEVNRRRVTMEEGSVWYLRLSDPHRVANNGRTDRVHLVIDAKINPWLTGLLQRAADVSAGPGDCGGSADEGAPIL